MQRELFPDLVRACALLGIAAVNVDFFAHASGGDLPAAAFPTTVDRFAWWLVATLFALKSYSLFALMFGVGFGQQWRAAVAGDHGFGARYARRMLGLLALGLLNVTLLFHGDILIVYAVLGSVLLLFRGAEPATLRRWAIGFYSLQTGIVALVALAVWAMEASGDEGALAAAGTAAAEEAARRLQGFAAQEFSVVAAMRLEAWRSDFAVVMGLQGLGALSFMLYGLYAVRAGLFTSAALASAHWVRARRTLLPAGLLLAALGGWLIVGSAGNADPYFMAGYLLLMLGSPLSTLGYLGLIARWMQAADSPLRRGMARAGGGSLSAYLLQGLLLSLVFMGYGGGLIGELGAATYIPIGLAAAIASLLCVGWWRGRYALGPVEYLLRAWVYLGKRPRAD